MCIAYKYSHSNEIESERWLLSHIDDNENKYSSHVCVHGFCMLCLPFVIHSTKYGLKSVKGDDI